MADSSWQALTTPFKRAASSLHSSAAELRELGNDAAFWQLLEPLNSLPEAVAFQVFGSTARWQVELAQETSQPPTEQQPDNAFAERISQRARQRGQLTVVTKTQTPDPTAERKRRESQTPDSSFGAEPAQTTGQSASAGQASAKARAGAWTIIEQIASVTELLEQSTEVPTARSTSESRPSVKAPETTSQENADTVASQPSSPAAPAGPSQINKSANSPLAGAQRKPGTADSLPQAAAGLDLLAEYVTKLWRSPEPGKVSGSHAGADKFPMPAKPQAAPTPAPRAPSLLQASTAFLASETLEVGTQPGDSAVQPEPSDNAPAKVAEKQTASSRQYSDDKDHEDLEERINRALIEQAWLRGVDLT